jgi:hypothetical protein
MSEARYFSLRRLNPYQGTVQVVEMPGFRAMSPDGLTWQTQILNRVTPGSPGRSRFSAYGLWRADGSGDLTETEHTHTFIEALRSRPRLPFPLADRLELWLLDARDRRPLALLAATFPDTQLPRTVETRWRATFTAETGFESASLAVQQVVGAQPDSGAPHGEVLTRLVREAAGPAPSAQWFRRAADGSAIGLGGERLAAEHEGRRIPRESFPELIVREDWDSDTTADLVRDYHAWHAPALLTHDNLGRATRARLEAGACRQAEKLYRMRYVLPEAVDAERLKVAMVEALIRRANQTATV